MFACAPARMVAELLMQPFSPECFSPCRCLHKPPWLLPTGASVVARGSHPPERSALPWRTKYTLLQQVPQKTAAAVSAAIVQCLLPFVMLVHTITADNGKEFAGHQSLAQLLGTLFFFARPYHSWDKGIERAYQRPGAAIFPEIDRSADNRCGRGPAGTEPAQQQTAQIARLPDPGGGVPPGAGCR